MIQVGSEFLWLWAATEPKNRKETRLLPMVLTVNIG